MTNLQNGFSTSKINWFPGHMTKALREIETEVKNVDIIIYILDSRAPKSSLNPEFIKLCQNKPILYVLNKTDLIENSDKNLAKEFIKKENVFNNYEILELDSTKLGAIKKVEPIMCDLCKEKFEKYKSKGIKTNLRAIVIGIPNSGKSTFINNLCGQKRAITGDRAGVTRGKQWLTLSNGFEVCDTPGTLWPNLINQTVAHNLAYIGSIKNDVLDMNDLAVDFLKFLIKYYPEKLKEKYELCDVNKKEIIEILDEITAFKHCLLKGGEPDYDRCCMAIIDDFRKGKLGKICLDK